MLFDTSFETEGQIEIRELARKFSKDRIAPIVEHDEVTETFRREIIRELGSLGLTGIPTSENHGGSGLGYQEYLAAIEEIAASSGAYAVSVAVSGLPQVILDTFGTEAQKSKYIPKLASGEWIGSFVLSEAGSGSDAASLRASAELKGDHYVLNGTKLWITQADEADVFIVMARTGGPGAKGVSSFILDRSMSGIKMGKREKKMGMCISHTMEIILEDVKVPVSNRIATEGDGMKIAFTALDSGRITIAATALGIARAAIETAIHHANIREQFGKPILDFQGVGFMLSDMLNEYQSAKLMTQRAAMLKDSGKPFSIAAAQAKVIATDMAMKVTTDAVQILGGSGYTREFPVERHMREAKMLQIVEGTNQIQRLVISRAMKEKGN
ncbi:MAG: acyl-CoA dehydrogenase family protein [Bdellovibrionales bacterium]|nr:acyl-CoA dehydrogenase family protein [Bdellovibrionales bacterium]